jgi:hypothetical protein
METKQRHPVNLKQYRKVEGKWQFVPVARDAKGNPDPRPVFLDWKKKRQFTFGLPSPPPPNASGVRSGGQPEWAFIGAM